MRVAIFVYPIYAFSCNRMQRSLLNVQFVFCDWSWGWFIDIFILHNDILDLISFCSRCFSSWQILTNLMKLKYKIMEAHGLLGIIG